MCAQDVGHAVHLEELADHLCTESIACSARRERELVTFGVGVGPDQIGHRAFVWNLPEPVNDLDLIDRVDGGRKATVDTEDLVIDHYAQCEKVEHVGKIVPDVGIAVFPSTLGIKPVRLGHTARLVVPTDKVYSLGISQFQAYKERDGLDAEKTTIHIVAYISCISILFPFSDALSSNNRLTKKQIVGIGTESSNLEDLNHIEELPMDIAHNCDRSRNVHHITFFHQKLLRLGTYCLNDRVCQ